MSEILKSLYQLQNRGYDSAGLGFYNNYWCVRKFASTDTSDCLEVLEEATTDSYSNIAMGHTRWATHGAKNDINSHPHTSIHGSIILVHNGIITNYKQLKEQLIEKNIICKSETDSEVIANWIEYFLKQNYAIKDAIRLTTSKLQGTWALGIINTASIDKIYITRHGSPLLFGMNESRVICSSETNGFIGLLHNYNVLNNDDIVTLSLEGIETEQVYESRTVHNLVVDELPSTYSHWTIKEICEQPQTILSAINNGARILNNDIILGGLQTLESIIETRNINHIMTIGCGTSYHASLVARYYFDKLYNNFTTVQAFDASEFSEIDIPSSGTVLCIVCSQSGETRDLVTCIDICRKYNCIIVGIVNVVDSMIAESVDCGVYLNAGQERGVASTKSFTSSLIVFSLIAMWFREKHKNLPILNSLRNLSNTIEILLHNSEFKNTCHYLVDFINKNKIQNMFILGKGELFPIAKEAALKIKELTYIHAEGYSSSSLKHGPFALLDEKTLTILLIDKKQKTSLLSTYHEIGSRETNCIVITNDNIDELDDFMKIPYIQYYQEIIFVVALQYLSYQLSISRGINPDKPRNLAKVVTVD